MSSIRTARATRWIELYVLCALVKCSAQCFTLYWLNGNCLCIDHDFWVWTSHQSSINMQIGCTLFRVKVNNGELSAFSIGPDGIKHDQINHQAYYTLAQTKTPQMCRYSLELSSLQRYKRISATKSIEKCCAATETLQFPIYHAA